MPAPLPLAFEGRPVRCFQIDGEPWFVAKDVAELLGYAQTAKAIRTHCKGVSEMDTPSRGGVQTVKIIPERDVYRLIMRSKLPAAARFEDWVVGEVLPAIRRTGSYGDQSAALATIAEGVKAMAAAVTALGVRVEALERGDARPAPSPARLAGRPRLERLTARLRALGLKASAASILSGHGADLIRDLYRKPDIGLRAETLSDLCEVLACDPAWLLGAQGAPDPSLAGGLVSITDAAQRLSGEGDPVARSSLSRYVHSHGLTRRRSGRVTLIDIDELRRHRRANPAVRPPL